MKKIPLTQGKMAIVDNADYELVNAHKWHALKSRQTYYARKAIQLPNNQWGIVSMHRFLLEAPSGMEIDHINTDGLDNRRSNLRLCTRSQNGKHQRMLLANKTGFKGVSKTKRTLKKPFYASIKVNLRGINLGYYRTAKEAARAYDKAAIKHHGEFALTNNMMRLL